MIEKGGVHVGGACVVDVERVGWKGTLSRTCQVVKEVCTVSVVPA